MMNIARILLFVSPLIAFAPAAARELAVDLSQSVVPITADFDGSDILLFGAADADADIVVVIRGPAGDELVRRKERKLGVWINGDEMRFENVPAYYYLASSRPIDEFVSRETARKHQIGYREMIITPKRGRDEGRDQAVTAEFRDALIRVKQDQGLYGRQAGDVTFKGGKLFRTDLRFPNNIPVGDYGVDVFVFRDGRIVEETTTVLGVKKIGIEAEVYDFANRHALSYGVLAVLLAAMAGWLASIMFRKG